MTRVVELLKKQIRLLRVSMTKDLVGVVGKKLFTFGEGSLHQCHLFSGLNIQESLSFQEQDSVVFPGYTDLELWGP